METKSVLIRLDLLEYKLTFNKIQEIAYLDKITFY